MPFEIVRNDITLMQVDAIVNAANETLLGGGGVDGAIHRAAGPGLLEECRKLGGCRTGDAKATSAGNLPCRWVIHTVGPVWRGGGFGEEALLASCYRRSLALAAEKECQSVAFPLISAGAYGYPRREALGVAVSAIRDFLEEHDMTVYLVVFDRQSFAVSEELIAPIRQFIDDHYIPSGYDDETEARRRRAAQSGMNVGWASGIDHCLARPDSVPPPVQAREEAIQSVAKKEKTSWFRRKRRPEAEPEEEKSPAKPASMAPQVFPRKTEEDIGEAFVLEACRPVITDAEAFADDLNGLLRQMDEGFREMLLRKIDESGMTDAQCYRKANIDRKLFNKIKLQPGYRPSKPTVLAFAIALEMPLPETKQLLAKAGFALSRSIKFDVIVEYFIQHGQYDIFEINEALFAFDQALLGTGMSA